LAGRLGQQTWPADLATAMPAKYYNGVKIILDDLPINFELADHALCKMIRTPNTKIATKCQSKQYEYNIQA
jgi:hypothetical protein